MAHLACDVDGTVDAAPHQFLALLQAFKSAGHRVTILTGTADDVVTQQTWQEKADYLNSLGCGQCWDDLVVLSNQNIPEAKAAWCKENSVDILADNDKDNARACSAAGVELVLVPWASRV